MLSEGRNELIHFLFRFLDKIEGQKDQKVAESTHQMASTNLGANSKKKIRKEMGNEIQKNEFQSPRFGSRPRTSCSPPKKFGTPTLKKRHRIDRISGQPIG